MELTAGQEFLRSEYNKTNFNQPEINKIDWLFLFALAQRNDQQPADVRAVWEFVGRSFSDTEKICNRAKDIKQPLEDLIKAAQAEKEAGLPTTEPEALQVATKVKGQNIYIEFNRPIQYLKMPFNEAKDFAAGIIKMAKMAQQGRLPMAPRDEVEVK